MRVVTLVALLTLQACAPSPAATIDAGAVAPDASPDVADASREDVAVAPDASPDAADAPRGDVAPDPDDPRSTVRFAAPECFPAALQLDRVVPGDLDRDGRVDLLLEYRGSRASADAPDGYGYARNVSSAGRARFEARVDHLSRDAAPLALSRVSQVVDVDGDGLRDLVRNERWWRNAQGAPGPLSGSTFDGPGDDLVSVAGSVAPQAETLIVADLNGDGLRDLASAQMSSGCDGAVYPNLSDATGVRFGSQRLVRIYVRGLTRCGSLAVGDLDGDGRPDLVVTSDNPDRGSGEQGFAALRNMTPMGRIEYAFDEPVRWLTAPAGARRVTGDARLADFDGDGALDLFHTLRDPAAASVRGALRMNTRAGVFAADMLGPAIELPGLFSDGASVAIVDLNGDGAPDLAGVVGDRVVIVQHVGSVVGPLTSASFATRSFALDPGSRAPTFADVDGDRRADLIVARDGGFCVALNTTP